MTREKALALLDLAGGTDTWGLTFSEARPGGGVTHSCPFGCALVSARRSALSVSYVHAHVREKHGP